MPRSLLFDGNGIPSEIVMDKIIFEEERNFIWTNLRVGDDVSKILPREVDRSDAFTEDLLEEQRPRIAKYQTLEDNDDTYTVIVLAIPSSHIFQDDDFQLQVSFVLIGNRLISATSKENPIFAEIMSKAISHKREYTPTTFFMKVVGELFEHVSFCPDNSLKVKIN